MNMTKVISKVISNVQTDEKYERDRERDKKLKMLVFLDIKHPTLLIFCWFLLTVGYIRLYPILSPWYPNKMVSFFLVKKQLVSQFLYPQP